MVIFVVHALGIFARESERHAPVAADLDGPGTFPSPLKFMQAQAGQIHVLLRRRRVEGAKNQAQPIRVLGLNAALRTGGEEVFQKR